MSSVLPYLFKEYDVTIETNTKGMTFFANDPRFKNVRYFEPFKIFKDKRDSLVFEYWDELKKGPFKDYKILNFFQAIEVSCVVFEKHPDAFKSQAIRKAKYGKNFYENHFKIAGVPFPKDFVATNQIYFSDTEYGFCERWQERNKDFFNMIVVIGGSTIQKVFPTWMESFCKKLIDRFPKLKMYLVGDIECSRDFWEYDRTVSYIIGTNGHNLPFKQTYLMTKYVDFVLGGETGTLVGAGQWGTPKCMLCVTSEKQQMIKYQMNDYSQQSLAECSPCYRTCYVGEDCEKESVYNTFPICTDKFDLVKLENTIATQYEGKFR